LQGGLFDENRIFIFLGFLCYRNFCEQEKLNYSTSIYKDHRNCECSVDGLFLCLGDILENMHNGVNCKLLRIFQKSCGRIRKIVVEYTLREQPGFYTWRLDRLDPVKGGCHMTLADILMCSIALCQLVVMVIALFQGK
jgi:hypothetical protein